MAGPVIPAGFELEGVGGPSIPDGFEIENAPVQTPSLLARPSQPVPTDHSFGRGVSLGAQEPSFELSRKLRAVLPGSVTGAIDRSPPSGLGIINALKLATPERYSGFRAELQNNDSTGGKMLGNMAALAPTMAMKGGSAVQGGVQGFALSPADNPLDLAVDTVIGVGSAFGADRAIKWGAGAISPVVRPAVDRLRRAGVEMTPGEIIGGRLKVLEDKMMSWPVVGDAISYARTKGVESYSRAAANKTLAEIGETVPATVKPGREMVDYVQKRVAEKYASVVPGLNANLDQAFLTRLATTRQRANLPAEQAAQFDDLVQREIAGAFDPQTGAIRGRDFKDLEGRLNQIATSFSKNENPYVKRLGAAVGDARQHLLDMLGRQNPKAAAELRRANGAHANLVRLETAAAATPDGVVTPSRLSTAVRQTDSTVRKRATAAGRARMQDLSDDGADVLSNRTPNSFTVDRLLAAGLVGGPVAGGAAMVNPAIAAPGLLAAPYLPGVRRGVQWLMTGRQAPQAQAVANVVRKLRPLGVAAVPPLLARPE